MKNLFIDTFTDGFVGIILGIMIWFITLVIVALIVCGILWLGNFAFMSKTDGYGTVLQKEFVPAHSTTEYNVALKVPITHHHPNEWKLNISIGDLTDIVSVVEECYSKVKVNDKIHVKYTNGRLWRSINITNIFF